MLEILGRLYGNTLLGILMILKQFLPAANHQGTQDGFCRASLSDLCLSIVLTQIYYIGQRRWAHLQSWFFLHQRYSDCDVSFLGNKIRLECSDCDDRQWLEMG
jgi:hypothetical protein